MHESVIKLNKVSKKYGSDWVLRDLSFSVKAGQCLALRGESGSGKSTCLKLINRLLIPDDGDIFLKEKNIKDYDLIDLRRQVAYVFQRGLLFPHLTVGENITLSSFSKMKHSKGALLEEECNRLLEFMDLDPKIFLDRYPRELSGGQAQRVSLAQAMAINPELILMDEPFNGLDQKTKYSLMEKILEIKNRFHKTIILVTHNQDELDFLSDKAVLLAAF